jgi:signal transduction histidine kinase
MLGGVASALADYLQVDASLVRLGIIVLSLGSGLVGMAYFAAWIALPLAAATATGAGSAASSAAPSGQLSRSKRNQSGTSEKGNRRFQANSTQVAALGALVLGLTILLRRVGVWLPDRLLWPVMLIAAGLALVWHRPSTGHRDARSVRPTSGTGPDMSFDWHDFSFSAFRRDPAGSLEQLRSSLSPENRRSLARLALGGIAVLLGASALAGANGSWSALRQGLTAGSLFALGTGLVLAPWLVRLSGDLSKERRARIRSEAQAEFAAHVHDSVLQTLALIQRRSTEPKEVVALARRQERELRAWLYAGTEVHESDTVLTVTQAFEAVAQEVEDDHRVRVELVTIGSSAVLHHLLDDTTEALVAATREAIVNAAKHAEVEEVSVFAEANTSSIEVYVRDRGIGFDPTSVSTSRRGIADSIRARMTRVGGEATVTSAPGDGTEIRLHLPLPTKGFA